MGLILDQGEQVPDESTEMDNHLLQGNAEDAGKEGDGGGRWC